MTSTRHLYRALRDQLYSRLILACSIGFIACAYIGTSAHASEKSDTHCLKGCPVGKTIAGAPIQRSIYTFLNNAETKFADWVAYKVSRKNFDCDKRAHRRWKLDPDLDSHETLIPNEYTDSNVALAVDRGHQAPLGSLKCHSDSQMTNYLSNITPQFSKLNQGAWKKLEAAVRELAKTGVDVWVMTGPLYEWSMAKLPSTKKMHIVPSSYWKIISVVQDDTIRSSAFYFYQDTPKRAKYCDHMKTIDFVEAKSGLDFFPDYADQDVLEKELGILSHELNC